ncbi:hypothetical protein AOZ06_30685 [Kibdelosporangium phytohabitans]|uniref:Uncharacterized protein n=1 Tax=Kibdelosporangium phytohabitans TaxID=860235 RepID=A0A0N9I7F5_9PSEU|nr:hypothetical protein AOZ06_30685 [Kibdelosporangium phytohabitans]
MTTEGARGREQGSSRPVGPARSDDEILAANEQLLELNTKIRTLEHCVVLARRRRHRAVASNVFGPVLPLLL